MSVFDSHFADAVATLMETHGATFSYFDAGNSVPRTVTAVFAETKSAREYQHDGAVVIRRATVHLYQSQVPLPKRGDSILVADEPWGFVSSDGDAGGAVVCHFQRTEPTGKAYAERNLRR